MISPEFYLYKSFRQIRKNELKVSPFYYVNHNHTDPLLYFSKLFRQILKKKVGNFFLRIYYSVRRLSTGFTLAEFNVFKETVIKTNKRTNDPERNKTKIPLLVLYAKLFSHLFIKYHDTGKAIKLANNVHLIIPLVRSSSIFRTVAPNIFLIPISFVRISVESEVRPKRPKKETKIAKTENILKIDPDLSSG